MSESESGSQISDYDIRRRGPAPGDSAEPDAV